MKPARFDGIVTRARLPETSRVHVRIHKSLAIGRLRRATVAILVAMAVVAATAASVGAQWPTGCVELNDIVELHLANTGNVGIYQQVFGDQAEAACRADHRTDVQTTFAWAFGTSPTAQAATTETPTTPTAQPDEGWPTTCVYLNDVVEAWLGNDHNVGFMRGRLATKPRPGVSMIMPTTYARHLHGRAHAKRRPLRAQDEQDTSGHSTLPGQPLETSPHRIASSNGCFSLCHGWAASPIHGLSTAFQILTKWP